MVEDLFLFDDNSAAIEAETPEILITSAQSESLPESSSKAQSRVSPSDGQLPDTNDKKRYFSINDVAKMFGLNASNLRFWEKEFGTIKPYKNKKGTRFYTHADIENIRQIHYLVREKGLTLAGARKRLKNNFAEVKRNAEITERLLRIKQELLDIQKEIQE